MTDQIKKFHELSDDEPFVLARQNAPGELTLGNVGRMGAAVDAFGKRADALLARLDELHKRVAAIEAEQPPKPRIYREAAK